MRRNPMSLPLSALLSGLLAGCGTASDEGLQPFEEPLGNQTSALCSGLSVSNLTFSGISSWGGELAGAGDWAVSTSANAVKLEYRVDGALVTAEERTGTSGTWYMSRAGTTCGAHTVEVKAFPMVIDSAGNRTTCTESPRIISQSVTQDCPTANLSCSYASNNVSCTGSGTGGTGAPYTYYWQEEFSYPDGSQYVGSWYQGSTQEGFYCAPAMYRDQSIRQIMRLKVRDNSGMESGVRMYTRLCAY